MTIENGQVRATAYDSASPSSTNRATRARFPRRSRELAARRRPGRRIRRGVGSRRGGGARSRGGARRARRRIRAARGAPGVRRPARDPAPLAGRLRLGLPGAPRPLARARCREREAVDAVMVYAAPLSILGPPLLSAVASLLGFAGIFWAIDGGGFGAAVVVSGSSLFTLGFDHPGGGVGGAVTTFCEATIGLGLLALVITYLPTLNAAFSAARRSSRCSTPAPARRPTRYADRASPRLRGHRDARRPLAGVGALDRRRRGVPLQPPDACLLPLVRPVAFVGDRDRGPARDGELPPLGDPGAGAETRRRGCSTGPRSAPSGGCEGTSTTRGRPRPAAGRPGRVPSKSSCDLAEIGVPLVDDHDVAWERFSGRRASYEPVSTRWHVSSTHRPVCGRRTTSKQSRLRPDDLAAGLSGDRSGADALRGPARPSPPPTASRCRRRRSGGGR